MAYQTKKKLNLEDNVYQAGLQNNVQKVNTTPQPKIYGNAFQTGVETGVSNTPPSYVPSKKEEPFVSYEHAPGKTTTGNVLLDEGNRYTNYISAGSSQQSSAIKPYQQYFEEEKKALEEQRNQALQDAKLYEERAAADAQSAYAQNRATYGANAQQLAQMGLTGGGYSDYLNAQAYAQKRSDIQSAGAKRADLESQAQATYSAGIAELNKEQADLEQKKQDKYTAVLAELQNPETNTKYTEDGLIALSNAQGWTTAQLLDAIDVLKNTKKELDIDVFDVEGTLKNIYGGGADNLTREQVKIDVSGEISNQDEINKVLLMYDARQLQIQGKITSDDLIAVKNGDQAAIDKVKGLLPEYYPSETTSGTTSGTTSVSVNEDSARAEATKLLTQQSTWESEHINYWLKDAKVVNVNTGAVTSYKDFNNDIGGNNQQEKYWEALKADLSKVAVGQYIKPNYGAIGTSGENEYFLCVAPGVFVALPGDGRLIPSSDKIYVPNGYKVNGAGKIKKG